MDERLPFPFKLYAMLQDASNSLYSSAVSWKQDGRSFVIHNRAIFIKQIVPRYFKLKKFPSFTRQLHNWSFTNLNDDEWRHVHFIRGKTDDLQLIGRVQMKEPSNRKIPDNFNFRQDLEDTKEEEISLTPSIDQDLPLQVIKFSPEIGNQCSVSSRTIPPHSSTTYMGSLHLESVSHAANQPDGDAPTPSTGKDLPLWSMEFCLERDNQPGSSSSTRTVQSHAITTRTGSLLLDSSSVAFSQPDEDDDLLLMCSFLELEDGMCTDCRCSFCHA